MFSTSQLANQNNWLPVNSNNTFSTPILPLENFNPAFTIPNASWPPVSNVQAGNVGQPYEIGATSSFGNIFHEGPLPVPVTMFNPDQEQKYGVSFSHYTPLHNQLNSLSLFQVGILFAEKLNAAHPRYGYFDVFVKGIYEGSPADRSVITEGDTLVEINGENIRGLSLQQIAPRIVGKLNSPVQLGFKRAKPEASAGLLGTFRISKAMAVHVVPRTVCSAHQSSILQQPV